MTGYIPPTITFISRKPETIVNEWEDGGEINSFEARPTYVATNDKTVESGKSWARGYGSTNRGITQHTFDNKSFKSLRITSYEKRNEGGGAFKAIADGEWYVDLRTDTLLDILVNHSIKNGEVQGAEFIWARVGSQAKVVRVGSSLHAKLVEATKLDKVKPPKATDLQPGDVYEAKNGDRAVFLGHVSTIEFHHAGSTSYSTPYKSQWGPSEHTVTLERIPKIQCWYRVGKAEEGKVKTELNEWGWYRVEFKKTSTFKKRLSPVKLPDDWMARVRANTEASIAEKKAEQWYKGFIRPWDLACYCDRLNVAPPGEQAPLHPELAEYTDLLK